MMKRFEVEPFSFGPSLGTRAATSNRKSGYLALLMVGGVALSFSGCSTDEAPLVQMSDVPTVVSMTPEDAKEVLEETGFKVEFTRPTAYCIPDDPLCKGPLDDEALRTLDVATQTGTQGQKRPEGSTITLILGSALSETIIED